MKRHVFPSGVIMALTLMLVTAASAAQSAPFGGSTAFTVIDRHGAVQIAEGSSSVTPVGPCDQVARVKLVGSAKSSAIIHGSIVFTDAKGDELRMDFEQLPDEALEMYVGTFTITGGTGKFEYATGSGTITSTPQADGTVLTVYSGALSR